MRILVNAFVNVSPFHLSFRLVGSFCSNLVGNHCSAIADQSSAAAVILAGKTAYAIRHIESRINICGV